MHPATFVTEFYLSLFPTKPIRMRSLRLALITLAVTFFSFISYSQDSSFVTVHYPADLPAKMIYVDYSDGKTYFRKTFDSSSDITFKKPRYWRYADVIVYYPDTAHQKTWILNTFWVGSQPAEIYIVPDSNGSHHIQRYRLKNAYSVADSGRTQLDLFEKSIADSITTTYELERQHHSDSLDKAADTLFTRSAYRKLAFLRQIRPSYFQRWLFRTKLASNHLLPVDTLLNAYHSLFPDSLQNEPEGRYVRTLIERRLGPSLGKTAPHYTLHATTGRTITSENTHGKYVLFDFWASWCGPCVAEMPKISDLHSQYDTSKLLIVSITLDAHEKDFLEAADRLHMTWPLIFGNEDIVNHFDVAPIPALFLMDPEGKIIYKSLETADKGTVSNDDVQLTQLKDLLAQRIGQH
jgi:thiol-disulfide isomerase/thioredoxin